MTAFKFTIKMQPCNIHRQTKICILDHTVTIDQLALKFKELGHSFDFLRAFNTSVYHCAIVDYINIDSFQ